MSTDTLTQLQQLAVQRFGDKAAHIHPDADFFEALGIGSLQALDLLTDQKMHSMWKYPITNSKGVNTFQALANVIEQRL